MEEQDEFEDWRGGVINRFVPRIIPSENHIYSLIIQCIVIIHHSTIPSNHTLQRRHSRNSKPRVQLRFQYLSSTQKQTIFKIRVGQREKQMKETLTYFVSLFSIHSLSPNWNRRDIARIDGDRRRHHIRHSRIRAVERSVHFEIVQAVIGIVLSRGVQRRGRQLIVDIVHRHRLRLLLHCWLLLLRWI